MLMAVAAVLQAEAAEGVDLLQLRQNLARVAKYCFKLVAAAVAVAAEVMAAVLAVVVAVQIQLVQWEIKVVHIYQKQ